MRFLQPSSESEMIACFLEQEYASHDRYRGRIEECLVRENISPTRLIGPDFTDSVANADRRRLFARYRGYGTGTPSYLTGFPDVGVNWNWVVLTPDELLDSRYIRYTEWSDLSAGTRSPRVAAKRIVAGDVAEGAFLKLALRLREGLTFPPLILVSADDGATRVVLEGHTRITAYALVPESIPTDIPVLLGMSPNIAKWDEY